LRSNLDFNIKRNFSHDIRPEFAFKKIRDRKGKEEMISSWLDSSILLKYNLQVLMKVYGYFALSSNSKETFHLFRFGQFLNGNYGIVF